MTPVDWLVMLYGVVSGVVYMHLEGLPFPANILIGAFVGFFLMLMLVIVTKVFLMWEYMRIPVVLARGAKIYLVGFLLIAIFAAAANGDWPIAAVLAWVLLPLLFLFCQPKPSVVCRVEK